MTEVATLKQALTKAEDIAAKEHTERERHEARVGEVQQELQALVTKHEALELDLKTRESELAVARESAKSAKAKAQKALQEVDTMKKWVKLDTVKLIKEGPPEGKEHRHPEMYYEGVLPGARLIADECSQNVIFE
ncbi:hypothetical protein VPH35_001822 [Triticum aestivum]